MKSQPLALTPTGYVPAEPATATHLRFHLPGPSRHLILPVMIHGTRAGTPNWTWNENVELPTLRPSILTEGTTFLGGDPHDKANWKPFRCHCWVNDGKAQFLDDTDHDLRGQTVELLDVNEDLNAP